MVSCERLILLIGFFLLALLVVPSVAPWPDLPTNARIPTWAQFDAGALVIDMGDRQIEGVSDPRSTGQATVAGLFNLFVYGTFMTGLAVRTKHWVLIPCAPGYIARLLHNNIPLYWVIRSNKEKDAVDFSCLSRRVPPLYLGPLCPSGA